MLWSSTNGSRHRRLHHETITCTRTSNLPRPRTSRPPHPTIPRRFTAPSDLTADAAKIAFTQFGQADNMTERQGALSVLSNGRSSERVAALDIFYNRYHDNALVLDKWFQTQALASRDDTVDQIVELAAHKDFTLANPNRARALYGAFAANQYGFHHISGKGYRLVRS